MRDEIKAQREAERAERERAESEKRGQMMLSLVRIEQHTGLFVMESVRLTADQGAKVAEFVRGLK